MRNSNDTTIWRRDKLEPLISIDMESQRIIKFLILDIYRSIMDIHNKIMGIPNSALDILNLIIDYHNSIMDTHNSIMDLND